MGTDSEKGTVIWTRRVLGESSRRLGLGARVGDLARQGDNISPSLRATGICKFKMDQYLDIRNWGSIHDVLGTNLELKHGIID